MPRRPSRCGTNFCDCRGLTRIGLGAAPLCPPATGGGWKPSKRMPRRWASRSTWPTKPCPAFGIRIRYRGRSRLYPSISRMPPKPCTIRSACRPPGPGAEVTQSHFDPLWARGDKSETESVRPSLHCEVPNISTVLCLAGYHYSNIAWDNGISPPKRDRRTLLILLESVNAASIREPLSKWFI